MAGGLWTRLYTAWRYGKADPYRLYNGLDEHYVPLLGIGSGDDGEPVEPPEPLPPPYPSRLRNVIYGFGLAALTFDAQFAGAKVETRRA